MIQQLAISLYRVSTTISKVNPKTKMDICNLTECNETIRFTLLYLTNFNSPEFTMTYGDKSTEYGLVARFSMAGHTVVYITPPVRWLDTGRPFRGLHHPLGAKKSIYEALICRKTVVH